MAEYVGEIHLKYVLGKGTKDKVDLYPDESGLSYRFQQTMEDRDVDDDGKRRKTPSPDKECRKMIIDPAIRGNWARYMNHSCRQATKFDFRFVGNKEVDIDSRAS
jgi:hypothetical protein